MHNSSDGHDCRVYAVPFSSLHLLPEIRRREALYNHGDEEPHGDHPGYDKNDINCPPMPPLDCKAKEKDRDRSSDASRQRCIEDLTEIPCPESYLGTIDCKFF